MARRSRRFSNPGFDRPERPGALRMIIRGVLLTCAALSLLDALWLLGSGVVRGEDWPFRSLGDIWYALDRGSLNLMQALTQRYLLPELWDPGMVTLLLWPGWAVMALLAGLFWLIARPFRS